MFRGNNFDKLLEKATNSFRLDPDWPTTLQICDLIRQNDCSPKYAVTAIKKKLYSPNPHQAMFALLTLESVVKNCGSGVHDEVTSKAFCEMLRDLVKTSPHENLKNKILELIQAWGFAFRNTPKYRSVQDTVNILKAEGYKFPPLKESDAMFSANTAPEWADGEVCHRCRTQFSLMVRRHHCRACGQVFCQQCSSKTSTLPKFGIEKEVRVCDACYDKVSRPPTSSTAKHQLSSNCEVIDSSKDYGPTAGLKRPGTKSAEELQEEEELQLALALSQSEAEEKEKQRRSRSHVVPESSHKLAASPTPSSVSASPDHVASNSELSRYLDRGYWEQRRDANAPATSNSAPTAPTSHAPTSPTEDYAKSTQNKMLEETAEDKEIDEFVSHLKSQVEIFVNRMKSNSSRGRSIANDTSVQTLFMNITAMHSRLLRYIQQQDDKRVYLESLQDKVNQVRDSRAALDTLRAEHAARLAAAAEAADRQRQMQMAAKLQAMRKKKHEYLQYQRQLALQRVQEQEREMQMRQEQQKHQYMMSANSGYYMPGVSLHQYTPGYATQPIYATPQFHSQMLGQVTTEGTINMPGQPLMSTANMQMGMNPQTNAAQSMPQLTQSYSMNNPTGVTMSQAPLNIQQSVPQTTRPQLGQNLPMQSQMLMQQMHQMRMPSQSGLHQMMPQNIPNGLQGQNGQMPQAQMSKQSMQIPVTMMSQMNMGQPQMTQANPTMQMQNMRMPNMQAPQHNIPSSYAMNIQNGQHPVSMMPNIQQPSQMHMPGQPMLAGQQMQGQPMSLSGQTPASGQSIQQLPTVSQGQPLSLQNQQMQPGQQNQSVGQGQTGQTMSIQGPQMSVQPMTLQGQQIHSQAQIIGQNQPPTQVTGQNQILNVSQQGQLQNPNQMPGQSQMSGQAQLPNQMPGQGQLPNQMPGQGQLPNQMPGQGQLPNQMPGQGQMPNQIHGQSQIQISNQMPGMHMQQLPNLNQQLPQMQQQGQSQHVSQGQQMPPGQQIQQGQQMPPVQQMQQVQQMPPAPQMQQGQMMPQGQPMQQMQNQQIKMQQVAPIAAPNQQQGSNSHPQTQQGQGQTKGELGNKIAELINFD